jgi:hypothetical protein
MSVAVPSAALTVDGADGGLDISDPVRGHLANVKLRGTLGNGWIYRQYRGETYAVLAGKAPRAMFRFQGLIKAKWTDNGDGTHTEVLYDTAAFLDWDTQDYLEKFKNPITGRINHPIHTWDGPRTTTYTANGPVYPWTRTRPTNPVILPWRVVDGYAWLDEQASFERPHVLKPEEWPLASSGDNTVSMVSVSIGGRIADLANPALASARHNLRWTAMRSWLPWLLLGQRPGLMLTVGSGRELSGPDAVPDSMLEILDRQQANFLVSEQPWKEATNSWSRYMQQRLPHSKN